MEKKYDIKNESEIQKYWSSNQIYKFNTKHKGEVYSIDTPPPTVSGNIHIGHIFSYTQAEMIARYQRAKGFNVFYPFGFDDNGLPTERLVERDLKVIGKELEREVFVEKCLEATKTYENEFKELWEKMGFSCDWDLSYRTIDQTSQKISQKSFLELVKQKKAYLEESPVLWCSQCNTSIAQAELESISSSTIFNTIKFTVDDQSVLISTTRPEMLYGCVAIFVHPDDKRYSKLIGITCKVPLYGHSVKILKDEKVQIEKGTGVVMCCTFGDTTDMEWYKEYGLPYRKVIDENGHICNDIPFIGGMYVKKARKIIINKLLENGLLEKQEEMEHVVSTHERCGTDIEIISSKQWYIDILNHKDEYLEMAEKINWYPQHMKKRYISWVENLKWNWCISRQRFFGVPIPVWYCDECGEIIYPEIAQLPVNPIKNIPEVCICGSRKVRPETAVLDTWATSSVTPQINRLWGEFNERKHMMPMSLRTQAHEIIRTWAFYTIAKHYEHHGMIPWENIMISGFVLAKKGEKISKSKNNSNITPMQLIEKYSADAIRYWTASSRLGTDMMFDESELRLSKRFMTKLWNAMKFSVLQLEKFDVFNEEAIQVYDKWIITKYHDTLSKAKEYLDRYEVGLARSVIDSFFWQDFCDNYLEYVKDRLYKTDLYSSVAVQSGRNTLYAVSLGVLKLYSIYVPHITEKIYLNFFQKYEKEKSVHMLLWDKPLCLDDHSLDYGTQICLIMKEVRKYKSEHQMSIKDKLSKMIVTTDLKELQYSSDDLKACLHVNHIDFIEGKELSISVYE